MLTSCRGRSQLLGPKVVCFYVERIKGNLNFPSNLTPKDARPAEWREIKEQTQLNKYCTVSKTKQNNTTASKIPVCLTPNTQANTRKEHTTLGLQWLVLDVEILPGSHRMLGTFPSTRSTF